MQKDRQKNKEAMLLLFDELRVTGSRDVRNQIVENYLYIAKRITKKYAFRSSDEEDIYQVACMGLMYAVDRFDSARGFEFETFAAPTIVGEIKKYYRDKQYVIRVPRRIQELNRSINQARTLLEHQLMVSPTITQIAEYLEISEEMIIEAMEGNNAFYPKSLSAEFENSIDGQEVTLLDLIGQEDEGIENVCNLDLLKARFGKLNPVEKKIIEERYYKGKTQREVAEIIGKSQMTISRIEKKVMEKLKEGI